VVQFSRLCTLGAAVGWGLVASAAACGDGPAPAPCDICRGDEVCHLDQCVPWYEAPLVADFELAVDGLQVTCTVSEGGFPRSMVQSLRFDFGDGFAGYGESISHAYAEAGVYPVDLEVRLRGYRMLRASKLAVVADSGQAAPPSQILFTINAAPDYLNGSQPYASDAGTPWDPADDYEADFHLLLPRHGFAVDVELRDSPGAEIDTGTVSLTADRALGEGAAPAGTELADRLVFAAEQTTEQVRRARWRVEEVDAFPVGMAALTLSARDAAGSEHLHTLEFETVALTPETDPFDRPMEWLFRFDMDFHTSVPSDAGGIDTTAGANGLPDFAEELRVLGAQGDESAPGADSVRGRGRVGANAVYERWIIAEIVAEVRRYYLIAPDGEPRGGIDMAFYVAGDESAPSPGDFATDGAFSMLRFGGTLGSYFGFSKFSAYNQERVDDTAADMGIATSTLMSALVTTALVMEEFYPILPGVGTPVGQHPSDGTVLADDFDRYALENDPADNARYDELARIAEQLGMAIAAVAAHEMGHAMGLVPNDAPPLGFFGDRADVSFIGAEHTNSHHVDFPFLNLMQAGGNPLVILNDALKRVETPEDYTIVDLVRLLALENRLSPYSRSYLERAQTYREF